LTALVATSTDESLNASLKQSIAEEPANATPGKEGKLEVIAKAKKVAAIIFFITQLQFVNSEI
jgi:hypothetical protein